MNRDRLYLGAFDCNGRKQALIAAILVMLSLSGCGSHVDKEALRKQLAGTWYTTNKTGRVLAFADDGRVLMFATATKGTFFSNATYSDGDADYAIEDAPTGAVAVLKFAKRDPSVSGDVGGEFRLISIEGDQMVLERVENNQTSHPTTLKRLDKLPLTSDQVKGRLPEEGYLYVPPDAETISIDDF